MLSFGNESIKPHLKRTQMVSKYIVLNFFLHSLYTLVRMNVKKSDSKFDGNYGAQSIPPEDIVLNQWYSLTINVPPSALKGQFLLDYNVHEKLLSLNFKTIKYLQFKFALELSKFGRMHLHGCVRMTKPLAVANFYQALYNMNCNYSFDTIKPEDLACMETGTDTWTKYMLKGQWYIKPQCELYRRPYLMTSENIQAPSLKINGKGNVKSADKRFRWEPEICSSDSSEEL